MKKKRYLIRGKDIPLRHTIKKTKYGWRLAGVMVLLIALISFLAFGSPREDFFGIGADKSYGAGDIYLSPLGSLDIKAMVWVIVIVTIIIVLIILFIIQDKKR